MTMASFSPHSAFDIHLAGKQKKRNVEEGPATAQQSINLPGTVSGACAGWHCHQSATRPQIALPLPSSVSPLRPPGTLLHITIIFNSTRVRMLACTKVSALTHLQTGGAQLHLYSSIAMYGRVTAHPFCELWTRGTCDAVPCIVPGRVITDVIAGQLDKSVHSSCSRGQQGSLFFVQNIQVWLQPEQQMMQYGVHVCMLVNRHL